jgi:hypothetical protein
MRKALKITIVLALLAVPSAALAAGNSSQPQAIYNCNALKAKPTKIILSCGDGNTWLAKLKWSSWTNTQAVASGNYTANNCNPDCAAGQTHSVTVRVTLSKPKSCPGQVSPAFKLAVIVYKGTRPQGAPAKFNFRCPSGLPGAY